MFRLIVARTRFALPTMLVIAISFPFQATLIRSLSVSAGDAQMMIIPTNTAARLGETIRVACSVTPGDSIVFT